MPNFPQISAKYAPKNQKRTIFHEFNQFWWNLKVYAEDYYQLIKNR
jgi:hypothetical protein